MTDIKNKSLVDRFEVAPDGDAYTPGERYGDATVIAPFDEGARHLAQELVVSSAPNRESKRWKPKAMSVGELVAKFCEHQVGEKDGPAVVLADLVPGPRVKNAVKAIFAVGIDLDDGVPSAEVDKALLKLGCLAIRYSTHSHLKTQTEFPRDTLVKWSAKFADEAEVDDDLVRRYMVEKGKIDPRIVETARVVGEEHKTGGIMVQVDHVPIPKHRIIIPLLKPFVIADEGSTQKDAQDKWAKVPRAVADVLGLPLDEACLDAGRLFYLPRHAKGSPFEISLAGGPLFDWHSLDLDGAWAIEAAKLDSSGSTKSKTDGGRELGRWSQRRAHGFQLAEVIRDFAPDRIRNDAGDRLETVCPNDASHSNPGDLEDRACLVLNATDSQTGLFTATCRHDACQGLTNLDMLGLMLADGWFGEEALSEEAYNAVEDEHAPSARPPFTVPPKRFGKFAWEQIDGRQWLCREGKDDPAALTTAFELEGGVRYPDRGDTRALRIALLDEYGTAVTADVDAAELAKSNGGAVLAQLRSAGLCFTRQGADFLRSYLCETQPRGSVLYDRPGWRDGAFVLPTGRALLTDRNVALSERSRLDCEPTAGTLKWWKRGVDAIFGSGASHLQAGLLIGFVGPVVDLIGADSAVFSFEGRTSTGKSTAQALSVSPWGPTGLGEGLFVSLKGTVNSLELPLERGSGTVAALDEARHVTAATLQDLAFTAQGGRGKRRMTASADERRTRAWRTAVSFSAETGFAQRLAVEGIAAAGGLAVRVTSIDTNEAPVFTPEEWAEIALAVENYGHAGPVFVQALAELGYVKDPSRLAEEVEELADRLAGSADAIRRRAARNIALLWIAGDIAQEAGLIPKTAKLGRLARELWRSFLESDIAPADPVDKAIAQLCETIVARKGLDIVEIGADRSFREAVGYMGHHLTVPVFVIRASKLSELSGAAADDRALRKALADRGFAIRKPRSDRSAIAWSSWPGLARAPYVVLRADRVETSYSVEAGAANDADPLTTANNARLDPVAQSRCELTHSGAGVRNKKP